jgi:hypothetical protein
MLQVPLTIDGLRGALQMIAHGFVVGLFFI